MSSPVLYAKQSAHNGTPDSKRHPGEPLQERLGIAGAGTIACGLAATAARHVNVMLWARSDRSAERAQTSIAKHKARLPDADVHMGHVQVVTELEELAQATFLIEAVVEDVEHKAAVLADLAKHAPAGAVLATTTSSLSVAELAQASGRPEHFVGLHVFNPVTRMKLVELAFPEQADWETRARARALCEALGKTAVEVPDIPGFVVNRLLFPYLFGAVEMMAQTGMAPDDVDRCLTLGAGMPMGPIALLDFVGLDVAQAIGETIGFSVPATLVELVQAGSLGRKSRQGFYSYD
jgi:3-hydroxybutyryl-CoA dehydrogenase